MKTQWQRRRGGGAGTFIALMVLAVIGLAVFLVFKTNREQGQTAPTDPAPAEAKADDQAKTDLPAAPVPEAAAPKGDGAAQAPALNADDAALMALYDQLTQTADPNKTTLKIQLKQRVDDPTLKKIAALLKRKHAEANRIEFMAPDAKVGDRPLATANLADALNITLEKAPVHDAIGSALKKSRALGRQVIGTWRGKGDNAPLVMLYSRNGQLHLESAYPDGSSIVEVVTVKYQGELRTYTPKKPKVPGLYYRLGKSSNVLEMHDASGPVSDFEAVDPNKP